MKVLTIEGPKTNTGALTKLAETAQELGWKLSRVSRTNGGKSIRFRLIKERRSKTKSPGSAG